MPYSRPSLSEIRVAAANDLAAALPGADPLLRFANLRILMTVLAGQANQQYGYLDWIAKQSVPFTATDEFLYAWGGLKDVFLKAATKAGDRAIGGGGQITFSNCTPGKPIPAGNLLVRGDGVDFVTIADAVIDGSGNVIVGVMASEPGAEGNCPVGVILTLGSSLEGIQTNTVVTTAVTGGAPIETQEEFRARMLQAYRAPPMGGSQSDYVTWATQVAGVTRAWCAPLSMGPGTVSVFFMMDDVRSSDDGFPQGDDGVAALETRATPATGDQLLVANYIFPLRPVTALVYLIAPVPDEIAFTIDGIADLDTRAAIEAAIDEVFLRTGSVGGTIDLVTGQVGGTVNLLDIEAAIAAVPGTAGAVVVSPVANIVAGDGELSIRGAMTWT